MSEVGKKLKTVLEGYAKFLRDRDLAPPKHQSHLVRWVRSSCYSRRSMAATRSSRH